MEKTKTENKNKRVLICTLVLLLAAVIIAVGAVFANWMTLTLTYNASSSQDTLSLSVSGNTITVDRMLGGDYHYVHADVMVFSEYADLTFTQNGNLVTALQYTDNNVDAEVANCYVLRNLSITDNSISIVSSRAPVASTCFAYPSDESNGTETISYNNTYLSSFYELQAASGEIKHNVVGKLTTDTNVFHTLYFVKNFEITSDFVYNLPCSIHLFYSNIKVGASFKINHNYGGNYVIDTKGGVFYADDARVIDVIAPNAFIRIAEGMLGSNVSAEHKFKNVQQAISTQYACDSIASFLLQASTYIDSYIPDRITNNVILPTDFQQTGVVFSYEVQNAEGDSFVSLYADGTIDRDIITHTVTVNVQMVYDGIYKTIAQAQTTPLCTANISKTVTVVGDGIDAELEELAYVFDDEIKADADSIIENDQIYYSFAQDASIKVLLQKYLRDNSVTAEVNLTVSDVNGSFFRIEIGANTYYTDTFTLITNAESGLCEGAFEFEYASATVSGNVYDDGVFLRPSTYIVNGSELTITIESGEQNDLVSWFLSGMDASELRLYIDSLVTVPAFAYDLVQHTTSYAGIIGVLTGEQADNKLYKYDIAENSTHSIFEYGALGIASTDSIIINAGSAASFTALSQNENLQSALASLWTGNYQNSYATNPTVNYGSFTRHLLTKTEDGVSGSYFSTSLTGSPSSTYAMIQRFMFDNGEVYYVLRRVVFSSSGYGESGNQQHYTDDTFAGFYAEEVMTDGKLLSSNSFIFSSQDLGFNIFLYVDPSLREYCYVDYAVGASEPYQWLPVNLNVADGEALAQLNSGKYSIHVDMSKLPARNINTLLTVYFYYAAQQSEFLTYARTSIGRATSGSYFATQSYTFTLPGVYHCGEGKNFESSVFYNYLLSVEQAGERVFNSYIFPTSEGTNGYLFTDGIEADLATLDFSATTYGSVQSINLKGIEYLSGVQNLIFDGMNVSGLSSLGECVNVQGISMRGCSLTDEDVGSNLYGMISLLSADLSDNSLTRIHSGDNGIFYRKIHVLNVADNEIDNISGIENMYAIKDLDLSGNKIAYFSPLIALAQLDRVNVADNIPATTVLATVGAYTALGTHGVLNIPVYSTLINIQEASIYVLGNGFAESTPLTLTDNDFYLDAAFAQQTIKASGGYRLLTSEQVGALILNGTDYDASFTGAVDFNLSVHWEALGGDVFEITNVKSSGENVLLNESFAVDTTFSSGDRIYAVVAVEYSFEITTNGQTASYNHFAYALFGGIYE